MNIRNVNLGSERADAYRTNPVAETARAGSGGRAHANDVKAAIQDRVEISDAARAALSKQSGAPEIDFARKALLGIPPMSEKRAADILARIQSGYYSQPEVLNQIAQRVSGDLGVPSEE